MKITWYGTASIQIESENTTLLIDPYLPGYGAENRPLLTSFLSAEDILITHGHFDHIASLPKILEYLPSATVYCSQTPADTLEKYGIDSDQLARISEGDTLYIGDIKVTPFKGLHSVPDKQLIRKTLFSKQMLRYTYKLPLLGVQNLLYPENHETLCYFIEAEGKKILLLGSLSYCPDVQYPQNPDLLILPYQGISNPEERTLEILELIQPSKLLLDHFDNAFPPLSQSMDTKPLYRLLKKTYPNLHVAKPVAGKTIIL